MPPLHADDLACFRAGSIPTWSTLHQRLYLGSTDGQWRTEGSLDSQIPFLHTWNRALDALLQKSMTQALLADSSQVFPTAANYKPGDVFSTSSVRVVHSQGYVFAALFDGLCGVDPANFCKVWWDRLSLMCCRQAGV